MCVNDALVKVLDQLRDVQQMPALPVLLRGCVDHLAVEVARVQGISEWLSEGLVMVLDE